MKTSFASLAVLVALAAAPTLIACTDDTGTDVDTSGTSYEEISARAHFDLWKQTNGAYVFELVTASGETVLGSQDYSSRTAALGGLVSVLDNGAKAARYTVQIAGNGRAYVQLASANGQVIATSQAYETRAAAEAAVTASVASLTAYPRHWENGTGARFEVRQDVGGKYFFNLHAGNGATVLHSERYDSLAAALNGAFSVSDNGVTATRYKVVTAASGGTYLNLTAANGQIIGTSEVYASKAAALRARDSIIALLPRVAVL